MNAAGYYAEVKKLLLSPTKIPTVFVDAVGMTYRVPLPHDMSEAQRAETIEMLKFQMGVAEKPF